MFAIVAGKKIKQGGCRSCRCSRGVRHGSFVHRIYAYINQPTKSSRFFSRCSCRPRGGLADRCPPFPPGNTIIQDIAATVIGGYTYAEPWHLSMIGDRSAFGGRGYRSDQFVGQSINCTARHVSAIQFSCSYPLGRIMSDPCPTIYGGQRLCLS